VLTCVDWPHQMQYSHRTTTEPGYDGEYNMNVLVVRRVVVETISNSMVQYFFM